MIPCNPINRKFALIIFVLSLFLFQKISAQDGKALFSANCASCHSPFKDVTGPALKGLEERGPWSDRKQLYAWIHNPPGYMAGSKYTQDLKNKFGSMMQSFPSLPEKDIDAIVEHSKGISEGETNFCFVTGRRCRIRNAPVRRHRLTRPNRAHFTSSVITDCESKIEL